MKTISRINALTLAAALGLGTTFAVHAAEPLEAQALAKATVSLSQASQIAEKQEAGKTIGAEFDTEKNQAIWEIKVLGKAGVKEYKIDGLSGAVVKVGVTVLAFWRVTAGPPTCVQL